MCRTGCSCRSTAPRNPSVRISVSFYLIYITVYLCAVWLVYVAFVHCTRHTAHIYTVLFNFEPSRLERFFVCVSVRGVARLCSICTLLFQMRGNKKRPTGVFLIFNHTSCCVCARWNIAHNGLIFLVMVYDLGIFFYANWAQCPASVAITCA